ncbi:hypothetical protein PMAYCL1PPCAC_09689, partial [Pristionchus mayeri]
QTYATWTCSVNDDEKRPFKCNECGKTFARSHHLSGHLQTHLDDSNPRKITFPCNKCDKMCTDKPGLIRHTQTHEKDVEGQFPHKCEQCGKRFTTNAILNNHKNLHLGEFAHLLQNFCCISDDSDPRKKKYPCCKCGKIFTDSNGLSNHM